MLLIIRIQTQKRILYQFRRLIFTKKPHTGFMRDVYNPYNNTVSSVLTFECYAEYMTRRIIPGIRL